MLTRNAPLRRIQALRRVAIVRPHVYTGPSPKVRSLVRMRADHTCEWPGCGLVGTDLHHRLNRKVGGRYRDRRTELNQASWILLVCRSHHDRVTSASGEALAEARGKGWVLMEHQNAAQEPVDTVHGRVLLCDDGSWGGGGMSTEFVNLTRGLLCGRDVEAGRYLRVQSTWCEQKRWSDVLLTTSPDLFFHAAQGHVCVVHDRSERERLTRAQWQGLSWLRFACSTAWYGKAEPEYARRGQRIDGYWQQCWDSLPERTRKYVGWFSRWSVGLHVAIRPCGCWHTAASAGGW